MQPTQVKINRYSDDIGLMAVKLPRVHGYGKCGQHNRSLATLNRVVWTYNKGAAAQQCMKYFDRVRLTYDGESCTLYSEVKPT